jgi:molybdate transport system permease protein
VLGASNLSVFFRITLPLVRPSLAVGLLMGCARVSGEVGITMMLGGNIAGKTNTLSLEIFNAVSRGDFEVADTLCLVLSLFAALLFLAMEAVLRKSVKL